ncbi:hypothetical protein TR51_17575 [Kitasatospora griseola]|uniref:Uncharacterized protein n=1 Tax=Kitasatospora griseola TaxID=2064 RepID=A0A0D0NBK0_KITGR|nr:DUF6210 family protein [Kitasatospora griseola]KIQ65625.1 hypothetical protein TR51_17575 [Kitasatospora griseola]
MTHTDDKRHIFLDPDGIGADQGWMFVIVAAPTGVVHQNQGGGFGCIPVPAGGLSDPAVRAGPGRLPAGDLRRRAERTGSRRLDWPAELLDRLRAAVADFGVYGSGRHDDAFPTWLALDESRLSEVDEAWVPVLTPHSPGVLVWENSD